MTSVSKLFFILFGMFAVLGIYLYPAVLELQRVEGKIELKIGDQFIIADVARTPEARAKGLGGRHILGVNEGMLFIFDEPGMHSFWMRGVTFPIDIVWIGPDLRIVGFTEHVLPQPDASDEELRLYFPPEPVTRVLELRAGRVRLLRVGVGEEVKAKPILSPGRLEDF